MIHLELLTYPLGNDAFAAIDPLTVNIHKDNITHTLNDASQQLTYML